MQYQGLVSTIKQEGILRVYQAERLTELAGGNGFVDDLRADSFLRNPNGFVGVMVLNHIAREHGLEEEVYVPANAFARAMDVNLTDILDAEEGGKQLIIERGEGQDRDLYLAVSDAHAVIASKKAPESSVNKPKKKRPLGFPSVNNQSLDIYLREIETYALLTPEEESEAAVNRDYDRLTRHNLRFVVSVAKKYQNNGVHLKDLISSGNEGLMRAAKKFDVTQGVKFISYAVWWIRQAIIQQLAEQSREIRIPLNKTGIKRRVDRIQDRLMQEDSLKYVKSPNALLEDACAIAEVSLHDYQRVSNAGTMLSLDAPVFSGDGKEHSLESMLNPRNPEEDPEQEVQLANSELQSNMGEVLSTLNPREAKILRLYFGLGDRRELTLEEIGGMLGITRERVRQIKEKALARLRHPSRSMFLRSFYEG